jgi:hypothetical protein
MSRCLQTVVLLLLALLLPGASLAGSENQALYDEIVASMESIRGLELQAPLDILVLSREEFEEEMAGDMVTVDSSTAADHRRVLLAFGLVEPGDDLAALSAGMVADGWAGFYDPGTRQLVVITDEADTDLTAINQVTFAHETVHALQDQHFDLQGTWRSAGTFDQTLAIQALIEGDASLAETDYMLANSDLALAYLRELYLGDRDSSVRDETPPILLAPLTFPYSQGQRFVQALCVEGGWDQVNAAYASPPATTEQVMHPDKYLQREAAVDVSIPDISRDLGAGWRAIEANTWGEFGMSIILSGAGMEDDDAANAHAGWGGDGYVAWTNERETALAWATAWDSERDASEFADALVARESSRLGVSPTRAANISVLVSDDAIVLVVLDASGVTMLQAPDLVTMEVLAEALGMPLPGRLDV